MKPRFFVNRPVWASVRPISPAEVAGMLAGALGMLSATLGFGAGAGSALNFSGGQFVTRPVISTAVDNVTMQAWVNWGGVNGEHQIILLNGNSSTNGYHLYIDQASSVLNVLCGGVQHAASTYVLPVGEWRHVAMVREASVWKLYINGVSQTLSDNPAPNAPGADVTRIGASNVGANPFNGSIDDFSFWNAALSQTTISSWMNKTIDNTHPDYASLLCYWQCDDGSGQVVTDSSSFSNHGQHGSTSGTDLDDPTWITSSAPVPVTLSGFALE